MQFDYFALCISLIEAKSPSSSEHLNGKTATIGTFLKGTKIILRKKVHYYLLEILRYLCKPKCLKKYQRLQFYVLYVPILDETPYLVTKCTVLWYDSLSCYSRNRVILSVVIVYGSSNESGCKKKQDLKP